MLTIAELGVALGDNPIAPRFLDKLSEGPEPAPGLGPCLLWTRATARGYGAFKVDGKRVQAHVWLYRQLHPDGLPEGVDLAHQCHNPNTCAGGHTCPHRPCVIHVEPKTRRDNLLEGSGFAGIQHRRRWCEGEYGPHDLWDPENVYVAPSRPNDRICKPCARGRSAAWHRKARRLKTRHPPGQLTLV